MARPSRPVVACVGLLLLSWGPTVPVAVADECKERVIEIVREAEKTTKTITDDGVVVFRQTWVKTVAGPKETGPGWLEGKAPEPEPAKAPVPKAPAPPTSPTPRPLPMPPGVVPLSRAREVALSFVGVAHAAGGMDPATGLNTPGLAFAFHHKMGVDAPRELAALYRAGDFVLLKDVRAGDLVFFHSDETGRAPPNMVGVALGGGEMVYLSGSKKKVLRAQFDTPWWEERYQGARRILGTQHARLFGSSPPVPASKQRFEGVASFYGCGDGFDGAPTASGARFDATQLTAAHFDLPFGTRLEVTNLTNGRKVEVRINDRGPYEKAGGKWVRHSTRVVDLSCRAAELLGFKSAGLARVRCRVLP